MDRAELNQSMDGILRLLDGIDQGWIASSASLSPCPFRRPLAAPQPHFSFLFLRSWADPPPGPWGVRILRWSRYLAVVGSCSLFPLHRWHNYRQIFGGANSNRTWTELLDPLPWHTHHLLQVATNICDYMHPQTYRTTLHPAEDQLSITISILCLWRHSCMSNDL